MLWRLFLIEFLSLKETKIGSSVQSNENILILQAAMEAPQPFYTLPSLAIKTN